MNDRKKLGYRLELDFHLPRLKIAFEYNGEQHYNWIRFFHKTKEEFEAQKQRDRLKIKLCRKKNIKLVIVKFDIELKKKNILKLINS